MKTLYTIGFTSKTAETFFESLRSAGISLLLDVRLNNTSQLAAFTKKNDLEYFLKAILGAKYLHLPVLAPEKELLDKYKADEDWEYYEKEYTRTIASRRIHAKIPAHTFDSTAVLLCSEPTAEKCHRRLAAEALSDAFGPFDIAHL